ncbi:cystatin A2 [Tieghemostelium lacteum]|uniref:Cystatin A2 n=1 Tax=Tieghemostelium lacteum TaxID=361077 RepID=A0A152A0L6_TIELA|nr:cystatin A2 [Tieghemostelium lacteum]|eukprot:KYQ99748.1 cystatin A2 [Tieghemostelium lacteum]
MSIGGLSKLKPADDQVREVLTKVKGQVEAKLAREYCIFDAISYKSQVVAGTNFFIKVKTNDGYIHLRVYRDLENVCKLVSLQEGHSMDDEITYF